MTRAIILAAGQGTRLRPLTDDKPKCLVPLAGKALLDRQAEVLQAAGVTRIQVVGGYRVDQIRAKGYDCAINENYASTNMVETLFCALPYLEEARDLLICYGDIVYEPRNLQRLLDCDSEICLMIDSQWRRYWEMRLDDPLSDAETLLLDEDNYVLELGKKPQSYDQIQGQYTGLIKIRGDKLPQLIDFYKQLDRSALYDGKDFPNMYMTSFLQSLIDSNWKVKAAIVENGWLEVDSVDDIELYEKLERQGKLSQICRLN